MNHLPFLHNVSCLVEVDGAPVPLCCRYPEAVRDQLNDGAQAQALNAANVEIRLRVGADGGAVTLWIAGDTAQRVEMYLGDFQLWGFMAGPGEHRIPIERFGYPWFGEPDARQVLSGCPRGRFSPELIRICFPISASFGIVSIEGDCSPAQESDLPARRLLCYGSSITAGHSSPTAAGSYAHRLAELLGCDLINYGSAGSAHCEAAMAEHIAGRGDWDLATLEMGINMPGFEEDDFTTRVRTMVATIAGADQQRPVFCLDQFRHFNDLHGRDCSKTLRFRHIVAEAVEELGGPACRHIPARHLPSWQGLGADLLHPAGTGMEEMARALAAVIAPEA